MRPVGVWTWEQQIHSPEERTVSQEECTTSQKSEQLWTRDVSTRIGQRNPGDNVARMTPFMRLVSLYSYHSPKRFKKRFVKKLEREGEWEKDRNIF